MISYMPQYMFNICAITAVKINASSDKTISDAAKIISANYQKSYDDKNLENEIIDAATQIVKFIESTLPNSNLLGNMTQFQYTTVNYETDGSKRKKKIFGGTWFNKERSELGNKVKQCGADIATYHLLLTAGSLPLVPKGWSL